MASSFYYPYFSARNIIAPPLQQLDRAALHYARLQQQQQQIELAVRLKEQEINSARVRLYEEELRAKQNHFENIIYNSVHPQPKDLYQKQLIEQRKRYLRENCLDFQEKPHKSQSPTFRQNENKQVEFSGKIEEQRDCQKTIEQYQQELLNKIQNTREYKILNKSRKSPQSDKNNHNRRTKKDQLQKQSFIEDNAIINKRPQNINPITFNNQRIKKQLDGPSTIQKKNDYYTIDVQDLRPKINKFWKKVEKNKKKSDFSVYKSERKKKKKSNRANYSINIYSSSKKCDFSPFSKQVQNRQSKDNNPRSSALRKINNRLKLSSIVFKDSQLSHNRYNIDHLLNTFEMQVKGRKDMKDKINNNPKILKKHLLVVTSR